MDTLLELVEKREQLQNQLYYLELELDDVLGQLLATGKAIGVGNKVVILANQYEFEEARLEEIAKMKGTIA